MNLSFQLAEKSGILHAGDEVSGKLIINASKAVRATAIELYFRGKEYTEVTHQVRVKKGEEYVMVDQLATEKHQIMRIDMPVPNQNRILQNGHTVKGFHEVPFRFQLPSRIPSTMSVEGYKCSASIEYCLRAKLKGSGVIQDYQGTQTVRVLAQGQSAAETPYVVPPTSTKIKSGLFNKGEMTYGAKVASTRLAVGQKPRVHLALVNDSKRSVQEVKIQLRQFVTFTAQGHSSQMEHILCQEHFPEQHFANSEKKVGRGAMTNTNKQRSYRKVLDSIEDDDEGPWCELPPVPEEAHDSFQGTHIRIAHDIRVKLQTRTFTNSPEFDVDVQIVQQGAPSTKGKDRARGASPKAKARARLVAAQAKALDNYKAPTKATKPNCNACNKEVAAGAKFCSNCGSPVGLPMAMAQPIHCEDVTTIKPGYDDAVSPSAPIAVTPEPAVNPNYRC